MESESVFERNMETSPFKFSFFPLDKLLGRTLPGFPAFA
jgi:hypothetical protein